jgi:hypothetical protein
MWNPNDTFTFNSLKLAKMFYVTKIYAHYIENMTISMTLSHLIHQN